jgi:hypothetical protein
MTQTERDQNLMVVVAAEEYAARHNLKTSEAFRLFDSHHINTLIRSQYGALHTQALEESGYFAEDLLKGVE